MNFKGGSNFKRNYIIPLLLEKPHDKYELSEKIGISHITVKGYISRINQENKIQIQFRNNKYEIITKRDFE
jgi:DNA-binding transcriptional regulator LsrR (DeoR family)